MNDPGPDVNGSRSPEPLKGIRVIDLTQYAPGPYTTRLLCDLGATVLKIEPPDGDPLRRMFCSSADEVSPVYNAVNQGKTIARLDLKDINQQQRALACVAGADIVLESYRPGVADKLGLGYPHCRNVKPDLVYASLSGYGQDGPYRDKAGHDINYAAAAGLLSVNTNATPIFPLVADHAGAMNAVNAILAAMIARQRGGNGCYLDLSLYESMLGWQYFNQSIGTEEKGFLDLLTGGAACYQIYETADNRHITVGALEPHFWQNLCQALDQPDWVERQFEPMPQTTLIDLVSTKFLSKPLIYWSKMLNDIDCCFEPVLPEETVYHHPQTVFRSLFSNTRQSFPGKFSGAPAAQTGELTELAAGELPDW